MGAKEGWQEGGVDDIMVFSFLRSPSFCYFIILLTAAMSCSPWFCYCTTPRRAVGLSADEYAHAHTCCTTAVRNRQPQPTTWPTNQALTVMRWLAREEGGSGRCPQSEEHTQLPGLDSANQIKPKGSKGTNPTRLLHVHDAHGRPGFARRSRRARPVWITDIQVDLITYGDAYWWVPLLTGS